MCRIIFVILLVSVCAGAMGSNTVLVTVKPGKLLGQRKLTSFGGRLYFAFHAIPYAHPPIDKLRFKNPQPFKSWTGTLNGTLEFYGACAQTHVVYKSRQFGVEDCLYLNIYTPHIPKTGDTSLKSVIVWVHGYAFASCFSHIHGPDFFINNDVILVTVAHRIGVFGFLKLNKKDSDSNMGLRDIVTALKWTRTNIKQLGGDKNKITLMGSGSGATLISLLMTTDANKLFSKAILHSGAIFSPSIFQSDPKSETKRLIQELKRKHLKLSTAPTLEILRAAQGIFIRNNKQMENLQRPIIPFTPIIEKDLNKSLLVRTPDEFYNIIRNKNYESLNKPILVGYNTQESISEVIPFIQNPYYLKSFVKLFKYMVPFSDGCSYNTTSRTYKLLSGIIKDRYFKDSDTESLLTSLLKYASDLLKFPILKFVKTHLSFIKDKMFMYKFDYRGNLNAVKATSMAEKTVKVSGVASGDELCYIFKCEPLWQVYSRMNNEEVNRDKNFIKKISVLWSNFAKFGDPTPNNYNNNLTWLPVKSEINNVLLIKKYFKLVSLKDDNTMFDFWNLLYEKYYKKNNCNDIHEEL